MKITERTLDVTGLEPLRSREPGIHCSELIKRILLRTDKKRFSGELDPEFVFAGFVWEEICSGALAKMARDRYQYLQQLEIQFRKIWVTIDTFDTRHWRVLECKFTESSSGRGITDHHFWHWMVQVKAYCLTTGTNEAELWVYFARGNYREKRREAKRWRLKFSPGELEANWSMLEQERRELVKERGDGD